MARSLYERNRDLISIGAYVAGSDPRVDHAIQVVPFINEFLQQEMNEIVDLKLSQRALEILARKCRTGHA